MKHSLQLAYLGTTLLALAGLLGSRPAQAQTTLTPPRNGYVARTGPVSAELPNVLKRSSRTALRVFGTQRGGRVAGTTTVAGGKLSFVPAVGFAAGETVWATLDRSAVYDTTQAQPLVRSQVWQLTASATPSNGLLAPQAWLPTTYLPRFVVAGDVDGDGDQDVLAGYEANNGDNSILAVRLNDGTGTFYPAADRVLPFRGTGLALGDVDSDGDLDAVVLGYTTQGSTNTGKYMVLPQGAGGLSLGTVQTLAGSPASAPSLADVDGDGDLDLLCTVNKASGPVQSVYTNTLGAFSAATVPTTVYGRDAAVGDLDGDGDLDVLACDLYSSSVLTRLSVRLNNGTGTFSSGPVSTIADSPWDPRLADVDNDGDLDAIVTHNSYSTPVTIRVWLNQGNAQFVAGAVVPVPSYVLGLTVADLDGDGDQDLLYSYDGVLAKALNPGTGTFAAGQVQPLDNSVSQVEKLAVADTDGDGDLEVLAGLGYGPGRYAVLALRNGPAPAAPYAVAAVAPAAGRLASRTAQPAVTFSGPMGSASAGALRATGSMSTGRVSGPVSVAGSTVTLAPAAAFVPGEVVSVSMSKSARSLAGLPLSTPYVWQFVAAATSGTGQFVAGPPLLFGLGSSLVPQVLRLTDLDGDHDLDMVTSVMRFSGTRDTLLSWRRNDGRGNFAAPVPLLGTGIATAACELADVDGDGDLDFVGNPKQYPAGNTSGTAVGGVWLNNGAGAFQAQGTIDNAVLKSANTLSDYLGWAAGDLDGDGDPDLMNGGVRLNDGQGNFYGAGELPAANYLLSSALADLDGDGDLDCVLTNFYHDCYVHFNDGSGHLSTGVGIGANTYSSNVVLRDLDNDGDPDLLVQGYSSSYIWVNDGQGHFTISTTQTMSGEPQAVGDVNNDGRPDVFTSTGCFLTNAQGQLVAPSPQPILGSSALGTLGDVDGDGDLDYVTLSSGNGLAWRVYYNGGQALATAAPAAAGPAATWPNPVASGGQLRVSLPATGPTTLTLRTTLGQLLWVQTLRDSGSPALVGSLPAGIYLLTVQQADAPPRTQRLTVE